jgi:hypothetical protein
MRLTLRTLLAYLDDTLPAAEIKSIGQKVAESDAAQELIARIKQVTRRRRLTTPPLTGPNARFDANDVAEYLDGELSAEKVVDLEKACRESDVHLAEVAACHQILTLVLGEPALVPPTAKERMYRLIQGRETIPFKKAARPGAPAALVGAEEDDDPLTLPFLRKGSWLRWALPVAAVLLVAALGFAIWEVMQPRHPAGPSRGGDLAQGPPPKDDPSKKKPDTPQGKKDTGTGQPVVPEKKDKEKKKDEPIVKLPIDKPKEKEKPKEKDDGPTVTIRPKKVERVPAPSKERVLAARNLGAPPNLPSVLVARAEGKDWARVPPKGAIYTNDEVVSLPGFTSEVLTKSDVHLTLRGNVIEYSLTQLMTYLMESAVVLHASEGVDLDLTLKRGRVYLKNNKPKGPAKVRLRFETEAWELALSEKAEVGVDLFRAYPRGTNYRTGEEPRCEVYLCALRGDVEVRTDAYQAGTTFNLEGPGHPTEKKPAVIGWNNVTGRVEGPGRLAKVPPIWDKAPPNTPRAREVTLVLRELARQMSTTPNVARPLRDLLDKDAPLSRIVALYCFTGLDDVDRLIDRLGDGQESHQEDRDTAIFCLRRWLSQGEAQAKRLYDEKTGTGALVLRPDGAPGYARGEAQNILEMLFDFSDEDRSNPDTFLALADKLESKKVAIAELAYWHLRRLSFPEKLPDFNAGKAIGDRKLVAEEVRQMVADRKLPPRRGGPPKGPPLKGKE